MRKGQKDHYTCLKELCSVALICGSCLIVEDHLLTANVKLKCEAKPIALFDLFIRCIEYYRVTCIIMVHCGFLFALVC